jgi:hypothetical protein
MKQTLSNLHRSAQPWAALATIAFITLALAGGALGQSTWIQTATGSQPWGTAGNWDPAVVPSGAGITVNMTANIASGQTVALGSTRVLGTMNISSDASGANYNFSNTGNGVELRANAEGTGTATINVLAGDAGAGHQFQ